MLQIRRLRGMNPSWGLAYGLVALLLCVSVGNHPVLAQSSFTVGEGFITGSVWTNTYNSTIDPNGLTNAYQRWAASVNVSVGDSLSKSTSSGLPFSLMKSFICAAWVPLHSSMLTSLTFLYTEGYGRCYCHTFILLLTEVVNILFV